MSLNYFERMNFEKLFNMSTGYILDFSNRSFQEFVHEAIRIDIYEKYQGLSKAKILRKIIAEYDDITVGKLLLALLHYMQISKKINEENRELFTECAELGNKLIGRNVRPKVPTQKKYSPQPIESVIDYKMLLDELRALANCPETPQVRGFAFEKYLNNLFKVNGLEPRSSFKITGEQIDGSFVLFKDIYLLEAKWTNQKIGKSDLVVFNEKVSSKSSFTRGLYISYAGYSDDALATFSSGRNLKIILMTVQELVISLEQKIDLKDVLWKKVRILGEEGNCNKNIFDA